MTNTKVFEPQVSDRVPKGSSLMERTDETKLGTSPYHIAQRYSRREITRDQVIHALATWPYVPAEMRTRGLHDTLLNYVPGSFDDVRGAFLDYLIDDEIYTAAFNGLKAQNVPLRESKGG